MKRTKVLIFLVVLSLTASQTLQTCSSTVALTTCSWDTLKPSSAPLRVTNYKPYLTISRGNLERIPARAFALLPEVTTLRLSGNKIKTIERNAFEGLTNLKQLNLNDNQLTEVGRNSLEHCNNLEKLDLSVNKIGSIDAKAFETLNKLVELHLGFNSLKEVPAAVKSLGSLRSFRLDNNQISNVKRGDFGGLGKLEELQLGDNKMSRIEHGGLEGLISLKKLDLKSNFLTDLDTQELMESVSGLKQVALSLNDFKCNKLQALIEVLKRRGVEVTRGFSKSPNSVNGVSCKVM